MIKQHADLEEFVQFWKFWFWQYTSRNPEYIEAFEEYCNPHLPKEFIADATKHFGYQFSEATARILWDAMEGVVGALQEFKSFINIESSWSAVCEIRRFDANWKKLRDERRIRFEDKFLCSPKSPTEDNDSSIILRDALNDHLNKDKCSHTLMYAALSRSARALPLNLI